MDLRERVIKDSTAGLSSKELAARYHVSRAWVDALKQRHRETQSIAPLRQIKFRHRVLAGREERLKALVAAKPDATLAELREGLATSAALATIWRELHHLGLTFKKTVHADEQRRADVAARRRFWREWQPAHDADRFVFIDECGVTTDLLRRYGRSPRGTRP